MTEAAEEIKVTAARARWRADLLGYDAAETRRIIGDDTSPTAEALLEAAVRKEAEATIHLDVAEAEERFSIAKQERNADPKNPAAQRRYAAATAELVELRAYWRGVGEATGSRRFVGAVDEFPEPSDEDVLASHGGSI